MTNRYTPKRYRNDRFPYPPANIPTLTTVDAVMSYIAKQRAFFSPKLYLKGENYAPHGIYKRYVVRSYKKPEEVGVRYTPTPPIEPLYVYDRETEQWYCNATPELHAQEHPCQPSVTPDKSMIPLPQAELTYLIYYGVMGLMEAKLAGKFDNRSFTNGAVWSNRRGVWMVDDEMTFITQSILDYGLICPEEDTQ